MSIKASYVPYSLKFNFDARTSRGAMKEKKSWFIKIWDEENPTVIGIGESGPLPGLSLEPLATFEEMVIKVVGLINDAKISIGGIDNTLESAISNWIDIFGIDFLNQHPSITFAL
jgi:hypothetical protein